MFGVIAALCSLVSKSNDNGIRTEQEFSMNRIYRESSADRCARKELASHRQRQYLYEQIKFVRLMKKLLSKIAAQDPIDEEFEQMRSKVAQLELKIERAARAKQIDCEDMLNLAKPDDDYDIKLEEFIRTTVSKSSSIDEKLSYDEKASGDCLSFHNYENK